jgi:CheY-like chemotaxis protein
MEVPDPLDSYLQEIVRAGKRSADVTRQLLAFARKQTISPRLLDLNATLAGMLKMLRRLIGEDVELVWLPGKEIWPVRMDPSQIDQLLANLCINARDAISGVGKVTIETGRVSFDEAYCSERNGFIPGDFVVLAVSDNGSGIDRDILDKIFEPFFTTKGVGMGTGLGLATVYGIVKQNNGFINVYSEHGQGTTFRIYLPRQEGRAEVGNLGVVEPVPMGQGEIILVVEDEESMLALNQTMLEQLNYKVLAAATPGTALQLAREYGQTIDLVLTDVIMPEMNGRELSRVIGEFCPTAKILFMSGYTANVIAHRGELDAGMHFITKPFSTGELAVKIRGMLLE